MGPTTITTSSTLKDKAPMRCSCSHDFSAPRRRPILRGRPAQTGVRIRDWFSLHRRTCSIPLTRRPSCRDEPLAPASRPPCRVPWRADSFFTPSPVPKGCCKHEKGIRAARIQQWSYTPGSAHAPQQRLDEGQANMKTFRQFRTTSHPLSQVPTKLSVADQQNMGLP